MEMKSKQKKWDLIKIRPRDWIQVSCNADGFFIIWASREAFYNGKEAIK